MLEGCRPDIRNYQESFADFAFITGNQHLLPARGRIEKNGSSAGQPVAHQLRAHLPGENCFSDKPLLCFRVIWRTNILFF